MDIDKVNEIVHQENKYSKYVFYGAGLEAEKFLYRLPELDGKISYCIDKNIQGEVFHGVTFDEYVGGYMWSYHETRIK